MKIPSLHQKSLNARLLATQLNGVNAPQEIEGLVKLGAQVDTKGPEKETLLMRMVDSGNIEAAEMLIKLGANVNHSDKDHDTPVTIACKDECREGMLILLIEHGADVNLYQPITVAASHGNVDQIVYLVNHQCLLNAVNKEGLSALMLLSQRGAKFMSEDLISQDAVDESEAVNDGLEYENEAIRCLLENGADLNLLDHEGHTAIYHAAAYGHPDALETFLKHQEGALDIPTWNNALIAAQSHQESHAIAIIQNALLLNALKCDEDTAQSLPKNKTRTRI